MSIKNFKLFRKTLIILLLIIGCIGNLKSQNSKWKLHVGYDQMYGFPNSANNVSKRHWVWNDPNRGDLFTMRTSLAHGIKTGISYDILNGGA